MSTLNARFVHHSQIDSTNEEARRLAQKSEQGPLWISADLQTRGRGRRGRGWVSEPGNLYASLLVTLPVTPAIASQMAFVTALVLHDTVSQFIEDDSDLKLKWPNDVLLAGKKFAGILIETLPVPETGKTSLAIGCGVNIAHGPEESLYPATWLNAHTETGIDPQLFLRKLAANMQARLTLWNNGNNFEQISRLWRQRACFIGEEVNITTASGQIAGRFENIASDGALILKRDDGSLETFHAGDVSLRPAKP